MRTFLMISLKVFYAIFIVLEAIGMAFPLILAYSYAKSGIKDVEIESVIIISLPISILVLPILMCVVTNIFLYLEDKIEEIDNN